jgi:hypothetical protein
MYADIQTAAGRCGAIVFCTELHPKRLQLLSELVPQARVIALLVNPNNPQTERVIRDVQEAARAKGVQLHILEASTEGEIDAAFVSLVQQQAGALMIATDGFFAGRREQLVALASHHAVPVIYPVREYVTPAFFHGLGHRRPVDHAKILEKSTAPWPVSDRVSAAAPKLSRLFVVAVIQFNFYDLCSALLIPTMSLGHSEIMSLAVPT